MKRIIFLIIFPLISCNFLLAQGTIPMDKKVFHEQFTQANLMMMEHFYDTALATFLHIRQMDTANANVNYKIGYIYLQTRTKKQKAQRYLELAVNNVSKKYTDDEPSERNAPILAYLYMAKAFHINNQFQRAIDYYDKFKEALGKKNSSLMKEVEHGKEMCFTAIEISKDPVKCTITNLGDSINSAYGDYSPLISADEDMLIFTSTRPGTGGLTNQTPEGGYFEDIWVCSKKKDGNWSQARSIGGTINTYDNEAAVGLSADGQQLFIYKDDNGDGNIYVSELSGDVWSHPEKFGEGESKDDPMKTDLNTPAWEPSACISADGNTIYFVSDRKGGYGGTDIYRIVRLPKGTWSKAQNLGPSVNTPYDEDGPFMHPDGKTLFFSSKGHKSMGGYDIFYAFKTDTGWAEAVNIGYPINTADDDIFYVTSADGKRSYYSSVKEGGYGDLDIYRIDLAASISETVVVLKGKITYNGGDSLPTNVNIRIRDSETGEQMPDVRPNPKSLKYIIVLTPGNKDSRTFNITYEGDSVEPVTTTVKVEKKKAYSETENAVELKNVDLENKRPGTVKIYGNITGNDGKSIPSARITVTDNATGKVVSTFNSDKETGDFSFVMEMGKNFNVSFEADGYLFQSMNLNIPKKSPYGEMKKEIVLEKVKAGVKITLNNIFFDTGKSNLRKESNVELEKLVKILKEYPEIKIEVSGHTDNRGDPKKNMLLSQARAQSVVNFLIKKGVNKKRLGAKGYGETMPVASNTRPDGKPDPSGMQINRRVEMKVVE